LEVDVGAGAALVLRSVAATLALPGPHGQPSRSEVAVRVAANGIFVWLPGPLIAARGCRHHAITRVTLEPGARLFVREELLLGRHDEQPGTVHQRLRVTLGDCPRYDQELAIGPEALGWDGPAVTGGRTALGSLLVVDPVLDTAFAEQTPVATAAETALLRLNGTAVLVTALAHDGLAFRQYLNSSLAELESTLPHSCA
jgi:urease accessory protein